MEFYNLNDEMVFKGDTAYKNGVLECYYRNGQICFKGTYVNGNYHGLWEWYHSDGKICYSGNYNNDRKCGIWKYYNEDGTIEKQVFYSKYYEQD